MKALAMIVLVASTLGCSSLSRAERVQYGLKAIRAACVYYETYPTEIPREPELDEICPALAVKSAETRLE